MSKKLSTLLLVFVTSIFLSVCAPTVRGQEITLNPPDIAISNSLFGMHIHHVATPSFNDPHILTPWPQVPFSSWRLWDAYTRWVDLEPSPGQWNFETLDRSVELAEQNSVELLLTLGQTPRWASARPEEEGIYGLGRAAEPKDIEDWRNYVRTVAERYRGKIHYYQIWNESNWSQFFSGSVEQMLMLTREAHQVLKEVDPEIQVVSPAVTGREDGLPWLEDYLNQGGGNYTDIFSYHFYVVPDSPEAMLPIIKGVKDLLKQYGQADKPLWNTETGWSEPKPFPPDQAVDYVARSYILNWASGVSRLYWYSWDNDWWVSLQLTEADKVTLTAAGVAYEELQKWMIGSQMTSCSSDERQLWMCHLTREDNYEGWILWNPEQTDNFSIPASWGVQQLRDLAGIVTSIADQSQIQVGTTPVLLETSSTFN